MDNPGLSPEVQQALQRRGGVSTPALSQVSPAAPQQSVPQPANPSDLPQPKTPVNPTAPSQKWTPQDQEGAIVAALIEQLKSSGKLKKEQAAMSSSPSAQMPAPDPTMGNNYAPSLGMGPDMSAKMNQQPAFF